MEVCNAFIPPFCVLRRSGPYIDRPFAVIRLKEAPARQQFQCCDAQSPAVNWETGPAVRLGNRSSCTGPVLLRLGRFFLVAFLAPRGPGIQVSLYIGHRFQHLHAHRSGEHYGNVHTERGTLASYPPHGKPWGGRRSLHQSSEMRLIR
jgi:hypothetical protein